MYILHVYTHTHISTYEVGILYKIYKNCIYRDIKYHFLTM